MGENELIRLKEDIKREIIEEMKNKKQESVWSKLKKEYSEEFQKFNYIEHWEFTNIAGEFCEHNKEVKAEYPMSNAIGTLLKIIYKVENVKKIDAEYDEVKNIVDGIIKVLNENKKEVA
jgi:Ni,Fe-hydrogenase III component G